MFRFVGGRLCLDFVGTLKWRTSVPVEQLATSDGLVSWVVQAGIVDVPPSSTLDDVAMARALRESLYAVLTALLDDRDATSGDVASVNGAAGPIIDARIDRAGTRTRTGTIEQALSVVARDAIDLIGEFDGQIVRRCAGTACTRLFVDSSRAKNRRWCGMDECGNQAKVRRYRSGTSTRPAPKATSLD
ncbi:CGNR zinc finger domain-containing protein [soil metagenome]